MMIGKVEGDIVKDEWCWSDCVLNTTKLWLLALPTVIMWSYLEGYKSNICQWENMDYVRMEEGEGGAIR